MPNSFINLCYKLAGRREDNQESEDNQYVLLSGGTFNHPEPVNSKNFVEDSESPNHKGYKKMDFINKFFRVKAKNSDDEDDNVASTYDRRKSSETSSSAESTIIVRNESRDVINRKKRRSLAYYDNKYRHQKKPGTAKIAINPENNKESVMENEDNQPTTSSKASSIDPEPELLVALGADNDRELEGLDPDWNEKNRIDKPGSSPLVRNRRTSTTKTSRMMAKNEQGMTPENLPVIKIPELKIAKMDAIQENENSFEEEVVEEKPKIAQGEQMVATANIEYEGSAGDMASPVIHDNLDPVNEAVFPTAATSNTRHYDLAEVLAVPSSSGDLPVFVQPRKNPWNVWPGLFEESLGERAAPLNIKEENSSKKDVEIWEMEEDPAKRLREMLYQDEEENKKLNKIAEFFAEEAKVLNERDIADYTKKIEISKIEIYAEDIKKYHQSLKYRRGPIDHDIIFTTVETALDFIEKLTKEREQKKKGGFLPEIFEKCLKSKAQRQKEKEEEERKRREKEEQKKKGPLRPKMWLVFNRISKEKVIICTPGEFYDSD